MSVTSPVPSAADDRTLVAALQSELEVLRQRERQFRAIADFTYDWESWHDTHGHLVWVNRAVERLTGTSATDCLALPDYPLPLIAPADRDRIAAVLQRAVQGGSGNDVEFRLLTNPPEDTPRWGAMSWQSLHDDDGTPLGFRTSVRDITERKRMEARIHEYADDLERLVSQRTLEVRRLDERRMELEKLAALGRLAAGIAHEINNPLAGIRSAFELIRTGLSVDHPYRSYLDLIDSEIDRLGGITRQIYALYRPRPLASSSFELVASLRGSLKLVEIVARRHGVTLELLAPPHPVPVHLPENEIRQVIYNVLLNALEASPPGGVVQLSVVPTPEQVILHVSDQGHGISPEVLPHVFEPFFTTKHDAAGGLGLGLSVSQGIVEALNGTIVAEPNPAGGAVVTITLPRTALPTEPTEPTA